MQIQRQRVLVPPMVTHAGSRRAMSALVGHRVNAGVQLGRTRELLDGAEMSDISDVADEDDEVGTNPKMIICQPRSCHDQYGEL